MGILSIMLKRLMANIKKGKAGPPTIDEMMLPVEGSSINPPPPPLMPQTITPQREMYQEGGELDAQMTDVMEEPTHTMPDGTVMPGATHEETQLPDEEMEEDHVEFIIAEALEPEEQQYLTDILVEDDQLSIIVDKIVETAAEFSGSGSVEGPGNGISDSIPARLSDGEFVMTAKATDTIGADTLAELMSLAEQEASPDRQAIAIGGEAKSEIENVSSIIIEEDPISLKNKEAMRSVDPRLSLFAS